MGEAAVDGDTSDVVRRPKPVNRAVLPTTGDENKVVACAETASDDEVKKSVVVLEDATPESACCFACEDVASGTNLKTSKILYCPIKMDEIILRFQISGHVPGPAIHSAKAKTTTQITGI